MMNHAISNFAGQSLETLPSLDDESTRIHHARSLVATPESLAGYGDLIASFDNKQGRVHACVSVDFVGEFDTYVAVALQIPNPN